MSLMDNYFLDLEGQYEGVASPVNSFELIRTLKDPDWNNFAFNELRSNPDYFPRVLNCIRYNLSRNLKEGVGDGDFRKLGNCLPTEILRRLLSDRGKCADDEAEALNDSIEVIAVVFYLAFLEVEYFSEIDRKEPFLELVMPSYVDREKGIINTPVELFFKNLLKNLVENGLFVDKRAVAEEIEDRMNHDSIGHAYRAINRYLNDSEIPSWYTFNEWIQQLTPAEYQGKRVNKESQFVYAQNLFGATRILDQTFRIYIQRLYKRTGKRSVEFFKDVYSTSREKLAEEFPQGGSSDPP